MIFLAMLIDAWMQDLQYGPQAALISEAFPASRRYTGSGLGYHLAAITAGGPAPVIATYLYSEYQTAHGHRRVWIRDHHHQPDRIVLAPRSRRRGSRVMGLLDGRVAIITGASKGIGRDMSQRFAREGAKVICAARSDALVKETVKIVKAAGGDAIAVVADASTEAGARAIVDAGVEHRTAGLIRSSTTRATADRPSRCRITRRRSGTTRSIPV